MPYNNQHHVCAVDPNIEVFYDATKFIGWWWKIRSENGQLLNSYKVTFCPACGWNPSCDNKPKRSLSCRSEDD